MSPVPTCESTDQNPATPVIPPIPVSSAESNIAREYGRIQTRFLAVAVVKNCYPEPIAYDDSGHLRSRDLRGGPMVR